MRCNFYSITKTEELLSLIYLKETKANGHCWDLKGHKVVGSIRASISYCNANIELDAMAGIVWIVSLAQYE